MSMLLTETSTSVLYGGLTFGAVDGSGVLWRLTKLDGWGSPDSTIQPVPKPRQRGAWAGDAYSQERYVTVTLFLRAPTPALLNQSLDALDSACDFATQPFTVNEAGFSRTINVRRKLGVQPNKISSTTAAPTFQVVATDPRKFGAAIVASTGLASTTGGLVVPTGQLLRTNLLTNPSFEAAGSAVTVRTNYIQVPQLSKAASSWGLLNGSLTSTAGGGLYTCSSSVPGSIVFPGSSWMPPTTPGETWIASYRVSVPADGVAVTLRVTNYFPGANAFVNDGAPVTINPGETKTVAGTAATAPANATYYRPTLATAVSMASGTRIVILDDPLAEKASVLGDFFDGSTPASGDFTYAWTGPVNASTSVQQAPSLPSVGSNQAAVFQSSDWASDGSKSLRISPNAATTDSFAYFAPDGGWVSGATYTLVATARLNAPQSGTLLDHARTITAFHDGVAAYSPAAPNQAGQTELRLTFTVADATQYTSVRLYNGASAGNGDVWWDNAALVEGTYTGDAFNGDTPTADYLTYQWTGAANASTSTQSTINGLTIPAGGLTIPATVTSGQLEMFNPGNETGLVEIRFDGDVTGPQVTHTGTGLSVTFSTDLSLGVGAFLDVDMEAHTALEQGQASRTRYITSRGWFGFDPGWNTYAFAATSGTTGTMTVTAYPAWR